MYSFTSLFSLAHLCLLLELATGQTNGIDLRDRMEEMEHILVDNTGTNSDGFVNAVTPCSNYVGFACNVTIRGEQSSAQWVRIAYHDFVTGNVSSGLSGLDASVGLETDRPENIGLFINDTLRFFSPTVTAYLSMSDNIALGVIVSVAECGGTSTSIEPKVGRIDATVAGPAGVPQPSTDLRTTLARFAAVEFDQADTIALTACGHSLGRVHYSNVPEIVNESAVTSTNLDGGVPFDATPDVFDPAVVNEFLDGTGSLGGPLVIAPLAANRSDLRLYTSDSNATLESISTAISLQSTCNALFQRMIDTVPSTVTLSDPITPMPWKAVDLMLDISATGIVSLSGLIRNLYTTPAPPEIVSYTTTTSDGNSSTQDTSTASGNGTSMFGNTKYWPFNSTVPQSTTSLSFGNISYPIDTSLFLLPAQSTVDSTNLFITLRAAALTSLARWKLARSAGTFTKQITNMTVDMSAYGTVGDYTLYEGSSTVSQATSVIAKVLLGDLGSKTVKTKIFVGGV